MTTTPNSSYVALADRIAAGKVSEVNMKLLVQALRAAGAIRPVDEESKTKSTDEIKAEFARQHGREVQLKPDLRPTYISGLKGHLGDKRGTKWEFYPERGTRAYDRSHGRAWRIPYYAFTYESQLTIDSEIEQQAEGMIS